MPQTDQDRIIALAGLIQATALVRDIAHTGQASPDDFATCIGSLFKFDAPSSAAVYNGSEHLHTGLQLVSEQLHNLKNMEIMRYTMALLALERKLDKRPQAMKQIGEGLQAAEVKLQYFSLTHENIIASLANIYSTIVSPLTPRIMVNGAQSHLTKPENADRIRALLLAGIRAARLWRQSGGSRLTLLLRRKPLLLEARRLLASSQLLSQEQQP